ncbi:cholesterol catabolism transcriptional regulator KstR [Mycobacterium cookii]|uniref:HTH-type transcriptional repressor KstR n=1 Tax=Mycobacterium cookii TaxID=1775 RepID=A0A7I7L358_9MYCO|nr:TetR family transcriptional regulator [Mycobacterium cookii]BBX48563.1 HTH-type transcriptional repressor KstR [Mycobacterium cookii]
MSVPVARPESAVVSLSDMTSRQLARRATIIEAVIELIAEVGAEAVQMRDVSKRSGVALATVYRYFNSKDYLLAAALEDWQKRLTRRILASRVGHAGRDPLPGILDYLGRAQRAFHRSPNMTALMFQTTTSTDAQARATIDQMNRTNTEMFNRLLEGVAPEDIPNITFGLNAALSSSLAGVLSGMMTLEESLSRVEWVARVLLADR